MLTSLLSSRFMLDFAEYFFRRNQGYGNMTVNLDDNFHILGTLIMNL